MNDEPTVPINPSDESAATSDNAAAAGGPPPSNSVKSKFQDPKMTATAVAAAFIVVFGMIAWTSSDDDANLSSNQVPGQWSQQGRDGYGQGIPHSHADGQGWGNDSDDDSEDSDDADDDDSQFTPPGGGGMQGGMQGGPGGPMTGAS